MHIFFNLLSHQAKEFRRGKNKGAGIVTRAVMFLLIFYLLLIVISIGFFMSQVLEQIFPEQDPMVVFRGLILYYFLIDFLMRVQLQELPTLSVLPYLTMNIPKKTLVRFLNVKSMFSFFNLAPLLLFLPFLFRQSAPPVGNGSAWAVALAVCSLTIFNNFMGLWLKRKAGANAWFLLGGVLLVLTLAGIDYFGLISLRGFSVALFREVASKPFLALVFPALAVFAYRLNGQYLQKNLYVEELSPQKQTAVKTKYPFFDRFGRVGQLAVAELKLILRNKRSKGSLTMSAAFVLYGFLFYKPELIENNRFSTMLFAAIFMTGIFQTAYGQFMFAWQSNHFDGLMANRIDFTDFIRSKFLLFTIAASAVTLLTLLYGFISWKLVVLHVCVYLYNIGFGSVIVLFFANYNRKRLDLSKGASFNWQGVGATQWIMGFPLILLPFLIYLPFGMLNRPFGGLIAIGIFGLITLAMRHFFVRRLTALFVKQRYKLAEGFRE